MYPKSFWIGDLDTYDEIFTAGTLTKRAGYIIKSGWFNDPDDLQVHKKGTITDNGYISGTIYTDPMTAMTGSFKFKSSNIGIE